MKNHRIALIAALAGLTGYCAGTAPAFADELCPRVPNLYEPHVYPPEVGSAPDRWAPDNRRVA